MQLKEEKETLTYGQQIVANHQKQMISPDIIEAGNLTEELGKVFLQNLESAIINARARGIKGKIYIHVLERPAPNTQGVHHTFFVRRSRPTPEQCSYLYSHKDDDILPTFHYALPEISMVGKILCNPDLFTPKYIRNIRKWLANKL